MKRKKHPYLSLPHKAFWKRSVAKPAMGEVDPVGKFDLKIDKNTKVATAGSCFAQHIARYLSNSGFNYYVAEQGHPILSNSTKKNHNYGLYSARYGNIYTARQLLQLFDRAYANFSPKEEAWIEKNGTVLDPFRPTIQPGGYISIQEMEADREQHLSDVRKMFETLDVFVFTLGLTECWLSKEDGSVFPLCPGVEGGTFDEEKYTFHNQDINEILSDMNNFISKLKKVNSSANIILTVSPVPLMATAQPDEHVLAATAYSKSVLRVAAEMLKKEHIHVHYFPSYEIITGSYSRGKYFANDLRSVLEEGVSHVMGLFLKHVASVENTNELTKNTIDESKEDNYISAAEHLIQVECDETALDSEDNGSLTSCQG